MSSATTTNTTVNINVGTLGHVDAGKTSIAKALSRVASTAAFDKNPQSQERGITLDLGFSAFFVSIPPVAKRSAVEDSKADASLLSAADKHNEMVRRSFNVDPFDASQELTLQFTLVDCPGHASLIRAVMGAAHIIDLMILVIDITKGIQAQTAECIVLGEMLGRKLVVVLNKVDLVHGETPEEKRQNIEKKKRQLRAVFAKTRWPDAPFVEAAASPGTAAAADEKKDESDERPATSAPAAGGKKKGSGAAAAAAAAASSAAAASLAAGAAAAAIGMDDIRSTLSMCAARMARSGALMSLRKTKLESSQFFMMVDHCFAVKGHGTVLTGTVVGGSVSIGDEVRIPDLGLTRRVKSIQVFRKAVEHAHCGDRIGLCVTQMNAERLERGIACSALPGSPVLTIQHACVCAVSKVRFHKSEIESNSMIFHVTIGHVTAMATMKFFSRAVRAKKKPASIAEATAAAVAAAAATSTTTSSSSLCVATSSGDPVHPATLDPFGLTEFTASSNNNNCLFDFSAEYEYEDRLTDSAVLQLSTATAAAAAMGRPLNPEDAYPHAEPERRYYALLFLDRPVVALVGSMVIASHLDGIAEKATCRLAMHGVLLSGEVAHHIPGAHKEDNESWRNMRVVRYRERGINIDKILDAKTIIARPTKLPQQKAPPPLAAAAAAAAGTAGDQTTAAAAAAAVTAKQHQHQLNQQRLKEQAQQQKQAVALDLTKFVGLPVVFRKKIRLAQAGGGDDGEKEKGGEDDDLQERASAKKRRDDDGDDGTTAGTAAGDKKPRVPRAPMPTVDVPGKIEAVHGSNGKVKISFAEDCFEGNRAFGSVLMLDKKYPFAPQRKVEQNVL